MHLTIEFTGRITTNDDEIRAACAKARAVIEAAGKTVADAWYENQAVLHEDMHMSELWSKAEYAATADMGEGASLIAFE
jgi:hypothetical protein